jgi:filamentous hemagglutinin family protein
MGGKVVSGQAVIQQTTQAGQSVTTITQSSPKATLNWQSFNVGSGEAVRFVQPSASAVSINRISDPNGSRILGKLSANGQVWLINPAGVFFGPGAQVNVGGLVASTLNLADSANPYKMQGPVSAGNNTASVTNQGSIQTAEGGYVAMLGANVGNTGDIASAGGRILLLGDKVAGALELSGRLDASGGQNQSTGFVETSAAKVRIADTASVFTRSADGSSGNWLIDPTDFTISSGSGSSTTSSIGATTLSTSLASSNVSIATDNNSGSDSGNIYVNSAVSWTAATTLSLSAYKDIYINDTITSTNTSGKLILLYGQGSASGSINGVASDYYVNAPVTLGKGVNFYTQLGSTVANLKSYQVITGVGSQGSTTGTDLQGMNGSLTTNYALGADIDASDTTSWYTSATVQGFLKIGDNTSSAAYYSGTFAGLGHVISDLYLYRPNVGVSGLFAVLSSDAVVRDTGMVNMAITTNSSGGLVGRNYGTVKNSYTTGSITSKAGFVGGLVGDNNTTGSITNSYSTATVTASVAIPAGGLTGYNRGSITNSYSSGAVSGTATYTGGLVGQLTAVGTISDSVWDTTTSGQSSGYGSLSVGTSTGVTGLSTESMKLAANYSNWDFTTPWLIYGGYTTPLLRAFMTPLTITASASGNQAYDGTTTTTLASYTDPGTLSKNLYGSISFELDGSDVGTHSAAASGFYSDQRGYQVSYSFTTNSVTIISDSASSSSSANVPSINTITVADSTPSAVTDTSTVVTDTSTDVTDSAAATDSEASDSEASDSEETDPDQETLAGAIQSAAANQAVISRKQNNTVVPGIAGLETALSSNGSKPASQTLVTGELTWDNHGSEYTGSQRLQVHPQFQHVLTHGDEIQLQLLGTQDDMKFGRWSYEWPLNESGWRMGAATSRLSYSLGGSAASLQAYGNASQRSFWVDKNTAQSEHMQMGWRVALDRSDLNDLQDETGIANQRSLNSLQARFSVNREGENFSRYRSWFSLGLTVGELWFRDTTADIGDATYAQTQGRFHKLNLSAVHIQALSQRLYASLSLQGQWSAENLDASQKMTFGGAQNLRAYQPGILSGDNGQWVRMELTRQWTLEQLGPIPPSQLATSLFLESAWLEVYRRPWSSVTDNQAKLSAAGVSLSWTGPHHWSASLSLGRALGKTPSLLSGSSSLHTSAWLELVKKFN